MLSGPGSGAVIHDYGKQGGHFEPPEGRENLDPFAYDIFTIGKTIRQTCWVRLFALYKFKLGQVTDDERSSWRKYQTIRRFAYGRV